MYVGARLRSRPTPQAKRFTLDFVNDLQDGDAITSVSLSSATAAKIEMDDPNAATCITDESRHLGDQDHGSCVPLSRVRHGQGHPRLRLERCRPMTTSIRRHRS